MFILLITTDASSRGYGFVYHTAGFVNGCDRSADDVVGSVDHTEVASMVVVVPLITFRLPLVSVYHTEISSMIVHGSVDHTDASSIHVCDGSDDHTEASSMVLIVLVITLKPRL